MFRTFGIVCVALALFSIAGGHWAVVQTVAWAEMLRAYSQRSGSLAVAVEQTFDGQHPCDLCRAIALAKSSEHKQSPATSGPGQDASAKAILVDVTPCPRAPRAGQGRTVPRRVVLRPEPERAAPDAPAATGERRGVKSLPLPLTRGSLNPRSQTLHAEREFLRVYSRAPPRSGNVSSASSHR